MYYGTKSSFLGFTVYNIIWHEGVCRGETLIQMFSIHCGSVSVPVKFGFGLTFCVHACVSVYVSV